MGRPFDRRTPFFIGLTGGLGVAVAYVIARGIGDITSVLIIIGLALFIAIGLNPIVAFLVRRGLSLWARGASSDPRLHPGHRRFYRHRCTPHLARGDEPRQQLPPLQSGPGGGEGVGRQLGGQAPLNGLPHRKVQTRPRHG